jgi:hypothetical protein
LIDIGEKTRELFESLSREGFGGLRFDDWEFDGGHGPYYACLCNISPDTFDLSGDWAEYFDWPQYWYDFAQMLKGYYESTGEQVVLIRCHEKVRDQDLPQVGNVIAVRFDEQYGNLEVYRLVDGRVLGPPEEPEEEEEEVGSDAEAT